MKNLDQNISRIAQKYLDLSKYRVFYFGSRVQKNNATHSDIDIGIDGPKPLSPKVKFAIKDELEQLPTLLKFDLVDFRGVSESFRKVALQKIKPLEE